MNASTLFVLVSVAAAGVVYVNPQPQIISVVFAVLAGFVTYLAIPSACGLFLNAGLKGRDLNKTDPSPVPESLGVICGAIYLIFMFLFLPIPFMSYWFSPSFTTFPHFKLLEFLAALLSICCMIFLGFADDVLNLRWRNKLYLPTIASLPLLMVYMLNIGSTNVIIPTVLSDLLGMSGNVLYLGVLYYVYMGMLAVFCTNAINIFAGINGVEAGQSLIIGISILINNLIQIFIFQNPNLYENHLFSVYFILPFITITLALLYYNWYPSRVFVGDTFCYFAGMTFAVVGILGHFSKTMLLFFIPQVFNFVYSVPQLFGLVPCPRHRLPKFDPKTGKLGMSFAEVKVSELKWTGKLVLSFGKLFRVIHVEEIVIEDPDTKKKAKSLKFNNLTIINFVLLFIGPTHEASLTFYMLLIQSFCTVVALLIRFKAAALFYDVVE